MARSAVASVRTSGGVGDGDAVLLGGLNVDVVEADREVADQPRAARFGVKEIGVEAVRDRGEEGIGVLKGVFELGSGEGMIVLVQLDIEMGWQHLLDFFRPAAGDDHLRFAHAFYPPLV